MWHYVLFALLGAVVAIVTLLFALLLLSRSRGLVRISVGGEPPTYYKEMELLDYEVREGDIWVRYRNTGNKQATTACFRIKIYDSRERLIYEREDGVHEQSKPGSTKENIIEIWDRSTGEPIDLSGKRVAVEFRYGYLN